MLVIEEWHVQFLGAWSDEELAYNAFATLDCHSIFPKMLAIFSVMNIYKEIFIIQVDV